MTRRPPALPYLFAAGLLVGTGTGLAAAAAADEAEAARDLGCSASDAAKEAMATVPLYDTACPPSDACWVDKMAAAGRLADRFPDDVHVQRYYQDLVNRRQAYDDGALNGPVTARYRDRLAAHPKDALTHYLVGRWEDSRAEMENSVALDAGFAWPHLWLAKYSVAPESSAQPAAAPGAAPQQATDALGATPDSIAAAANHLEAFLKLCPGRLDAVFQQPGQVHPEVKRAELPIVRRALEAAPHADQMRWLSSIWDQEFKTRPTTEHDAVRRQVAADVARIASWKETRDDGWWQAQHQGLSMLDDPAALERLDAEYARRFPCSRVAVERLDAAWVKRSGGVERNFDAVPPAEWAEAYKAFGRAANRCPDDFSLMSMRFAAAARLQPPLSDRRLEAEADRYLERWERVKGNWGVPTTPYDDVATQYLRRRIRAEQVPDLLARERDYQKAWKQPSGLPPEVAKRVEEGAVLYEFRQLGMEAEADLLAGRRTQAEAAIRAAQALGPLPAPAGVYKLSAAETHARYERVRAALGLPDDSATADASPGPSASAAGGSTAAARQGDQSWTLKNDTLPEWTLVDLDGRTWRSTDLVGKTVVVNVWATWCGPCRAELPSVKALHERLRGRDDVVLVSFNVDQEVGLVAPFARAQGLGYPILLAADYMQGLGMNSVPQNWLIGPEGVRREMQLGFDPGATGWVDDTVALIDRVVSSASGVAR